MTDGKTNRHILNTPEYSGVGVTGVCNTPYPHVPETSVGGNVELCRVRTEASRIGKAQVR